MGVYVMRNLKEVGTIPLVTLRQEKKPTKKWNDGSTGMTLPEFIDNSDAVQKYLENADEIERLKAQLKELEVENSAFKKELAPYIKQVENASYRIAEGKNLILKVKTASSSRITFPYQEALTIAFEKLEDDSRELVNQFLLDQAKLTEISASFDVSLKENVIAENIKRGNIRESFFGKLKDIVYNYFKKASRVVSDLLHSIDDTLYEVEKVISKVK